MEDVEKIILNRQEERLLRYIENYHLWVKDSRADSKEFQTIDSYQMLDYCHDKQFPFEYLTDSNGEPTTIAEYNAYMTAKDVWKYWRYAKRKRKEESRGFRRDLIIGIVSYLAGTVFTLATEHFTEIIAFFQKVAQHH